MGTKACIAPPTILELSFRKLWVLGPIYMQLMRSKFNNLVNFQWPLRESELMIIEEQVQDPTN